MEKILDEQAVLLKIKTDALRLLTFRPRSVEELRQRLVIKRYPEPLVAQVLESLKKQGLLDDVKFAKLYAESRVYSRPTGKRQLVADLRKKGLSQALVEQTVAGIKDYDEKEMAASIARGRFLKMSGISPEKKKARIFGFLKRRGFGSDAIFSVMNELFKERGEL